MRVEGVMKVETFFQTYATIPTNLFFSERNDSAAFSMSESVSFHSPTSMTELR